MKIRIKQIICALFICAAVTTAASAADYTRSVYLADSSFTDGVYGWISGAEGGNAYAGIISHGYGDGDTAALNLWVETTDQKAYAYKVLRGLAPGKYTFSAYVYGGVDSGGSGTAYMYAKTSKETKTNSTYTGSYAQQTIEIDVPDDGVLEIGFIAENGEKLWYNADEVTLVCTEEHAPYGGFIQNSSFESGTEGYTLNGAVTNENGRTGNCLSVPNGASAAVTLENLEDGLYEASVYFKSTNADSVITAVSGEHTASARMPVSSEWKRAVVPDVYVENGTVDITVRSGGELYIDDLSLKKSYKYRNFITGGDITQASYLESKGAKYYYEDGTEGDCVKILADNGVNMARVRVYNDTGKDTAVTLRSEYDGTVYENSYYLPEGYHTAEDALALCRRAKDNGMQIEFTFHYSDFWTNAEQQFIPREWDNQIEYKANYDAAADTLENEIYKYTKDIMQKLKEQGTVPEMVSIGNEIQNGMLYPYGNISEDSERWKYLARFINAGSRAVREVSPSTRIILHLDDCGNYYKYCDFFDKCKQYNVDYDIIGASYYPYWSQKTIEHTVEFCNMITEKFDKDIIIMETGYNFYPYKSTENEWTGQLKDNGPYEKIYPPTQEGHKSFMADLFNGLKSAQRCIGDIYWDPIMINCEGTGWAINADTDVSEDNLIPNSALFDFVEHNGRALPSLAVFADTKSADYSTDIGLPDMQNRFEAHEQNGRVHIKNISEKDENIIVFNAQYKDGILDGVKLDKRVLKHGQDASFENGRYTFVWTEDTICPITYRSGISREPNK